MPYSKTYIATPPGVTIEEQLEDHGITLAELSDKMALPEKTVVRLLRGDIRLTQDIANKLESVFDITAQFWLNLEKLYREKLFLVEAENAMEADIARISRTGVSAQATSGTI